MKSVGNELESYRQGLVEEIEFWQELLGESNLNVHSPEYKRMEDALLLAHFKLAKYEQDLDLL